MKNILFILFLLLLLAFSAETKAQTKEETIEWLKSKLALPKVAGCEDCTNDRLYLPPNFNKELEKCRFALEHTFTSSNDNRKYLESYSISLLSEIKLNSKNELSLDFDGVLLNGYGLPDNGERILLEENLVHNAIFFELREAETNLPARIVKAINHLRSFCPNKPTEKF